MHYVHYLLHHKAALRIQNAWSMLKLRRLTAHEVRRREEEVAGVVPLLYEKMQKEWASVLAGSVN